jgi:hypothetical protein
MTSFTSKLKVGILTFHDGPNYGGYMQAWHLRQAIKDLGMDVTTINYLHPKHAASNQNIMPIRNVGSLKARIHWELKRFPFRGIAKSLCDHPFTSNPASIPWQSYHRIVVGSDVVWDFETDEFGHDPAYFGSIAEQEGASFMSYAASCGSANVEGPLPEYCKGLKNFVALGVRDQSTAALAKRITDRDAELVVDPTWLQDDPENDFGRNIGHKYILVYGTPLQGEFADELVKMCRSKGWIIISAGAGGACIDKTYRMLTPFQWVSLVKNAEATVVGGLHGTLYSIKYGKPFILVSRKNSRQKARYVLEVTGQIFRQITPEDLDRHHVNLLQNNSLLPTGIPFNSTSILAYKIGNFP